MEYLASGIFFTMVCIAVYVFRQRHKSIRKAVAAKELREQLEYKTILTSYKGADRANATTAFREKVLSEDAREELKLKLVKND